MMVGTAQTANNVCSWKPYHLEVLNSNRNQALCWGRCTGKTTTLVEQSMRVVKQGGKVFYDAVSHAMYGYVINMFRGHIDWYEDMQHNRVCFMQFGAAGRRPSELVDGFDLVVFDEISFATKALEPRRDVFWKALFGKKRILISSSPGMNKKFDEFCKDPPKCFDVIKTPTGAYTNNAELKSDDEISLAPFA